MLGWAHSFLIHLMHLLDETSHVIFVPDMFYLIIFKYVNLYLLKLKLLSFARYEITIWYEGSCHGLVFGINIALNNFEKHEMKLWTCNWCNSCYEEKRTKKNYQTIWKFLFRNKTKVLISNISFGAWYIQWESRNLTLCELHLGET